MNDRLRLDDQTAIVTGAGAGIGRAIAIRLAEAGADVVVAEIDPDRADEAAERVRDAGAQALVYPLDVMDGEAVQAMVGAADARFGRIDILVNNAGGVSGRSFLDQSPRSWRRHIDINLTSLLYATHAAAPVMIRGGRGGAIVNVASIEASRAAPMFAVYGACKAALVSFTRSMALELADHRIRVNAIAPDHTVTPGNQGNHAGPVDPSTWTRRTAEEDAAWTRLIPLGREGVDTECGDAALFLCSQMASYVTGAVLPVDGGTSAAGGWVRNPDGGWTLNAPLRFAGGGPPAAPRS